MAIITVDENNYITGLYVGDGFSIADGIEVALPFDADELFSNIGVYRYVGGEFIKDEKKAVTKADEDALAELRGRRKTECFTVINRGQLWYAQLTEAQAAELAEWYHAWLDVTESRVIPETPAWVQMSLAQEV